MSFERTIWFDKFKYLKWIIRLDNDIFKTRGGQSDS